VSAPQAEERVERAPQLVRLRCLGERQCKVGHDHVLGERDWQFAHNPRLLGCRPLALGLALGGLALGVKLLVAVQGVIDRSADVLSNASDDEAALDRPRSPFVDQLISGGTLDDAELADVSHRTSDDSPTNSRIHWVAPPMSGRPLK
jgi:hypothetical protein